MNTTGLVLSGGGHRGVAHAGAILAFEECGIFPHVVSGTSAGAVVGALYAAGHTPAEILELFKKIKLFSFSYFARKKAGWVNSNAFVNFLLKYFPENSFETLSKKLFITTADLMNGKTRVFSEGKLIPSILASAAIPGVFTPIEIDGNLYADGGIVNNFPVYPILKECDEIYGVYVSPLKIMEATDFRYSYEVANRAIHLLMHEHSVKQFDLCKLVICPDELANYGLFSASHADEIFEIGYKTALKQLRSKNLKS